MWKYKDELDKLWKDSVQALREVTGQSDINGIHYRVGDADVAQIRSKQPIDEKDVRHVYDSPTLRISQREHADWKNVTDLVDTGKILPDGKGE